MRPLRCTLLPQSKMHLNLPAKLSSHRYSGKKSRRRTNIQQQLCLPDLGNLWRKLPILFLIPIPIPFPNRIARARNLKREDLTPAALIRNVCVSATPLNNVGLKEVVQKGNNLLSPEILNLGIVLRLGILEKRRMERLLF